MDRNARKLVHLIESGRFADAETACRAALTARPADALAWNLLGIALRRLDRLDEAQDAFGRAVAHDERNPDYRANQAQLLRARGAFGESLAAFERALDFDPANRAARLGLAQTAIQAGQPALAEQHARILIEADAKDAEAWSALGSALHLSGDSAAAADALTRAVSIAPGYTAARRNLAAVLVAEERAEDALRELDSLARQGGDEEAMLPVRARALMQLDRYTESEEALVRHIARMPDDRDSQFLLAQLRHIGGDADFLSELRRAAMRAGAPVQTRAQYADLLRRSGALADAEDALRAMLAELGPLPPLQSSLATVLQEAGRFDDAAAAALAAHRALPDDATIAENWIACALSAGEADAVLPVIERFRTREPSNQRWITYRTDAARQSGDALFGDWCDIDGLVRVFELEPPSGYATIGAFHEELRAHLDGLHRQASHPLDQSLRQGTQTSRSLLADPHPLIRRYLELLEAPIADYQRAIGSDAGHPMRSRNSRPARPTGCWSVRLRRDGFHVNHIHPRGWISSAYYVSVPAETVDPARMSGWLKFAEPRFPMPRATPLHFVQPREGRLVLFPSYFWHGTNPIAGDEPRLTIAFDCLPEPERK